MFSDTAFPSGDLPGLPNVDYVDSVRASLPQIWLHVNLQVLRPHVTLCCEEHFNILRGRIKDCGEVCGRHDCGRRGCQSKSKQEAVDSRGGDREALGDFLCGRNWAACEKFDLARFRYSANLMASLNFGELDKDSRRLNCKVRIARFSTPCLLG
jgi:hypothetical protein